MKHERLLFGFGLALVLAGQALRGQQSDTDGKKLAELRAKAEKGDAKAEDELGSAFLWGKLGAAKNKAEAVRWYRKAAEQNFAKAQFYLDACYVEGQGVAQDMVEGVKWLRKAAEQNDAKAQFGLAIRYANGQGVAKDEAEAYKWVILAVAQNDENAKQNKASLEAMLSQEQIAEGKRRANDWLEQRKKASVGGR